ncbi:MAG: protein jag [Actinomycetota bacterium]|nr:protein jag [Actinomycetota bacterium]
MTETREFYAATVDEAVEKASATLGVSSEELSYEVVDAGSEGFLGIGARDARIVVEVSEMARTDTVEEADEANTEPADAALGSMELSEVLGESSEAESVGVPEEFLGEIKDLVASVVEAMGFDPRIDVYDAGSFIAVDVASDNTALFIGQKGETIDALQYLVNAAVYRRRPFVKRIILDAEGYRQRRVEAIQGIAHRTARRAIRERRTVELPPMNPSERRIVHIFLKDNPKVTTASEGSGGNRRVRISPV